MRRLGKAMTRESRFGARPRGWRGPLLLLVLGVVLGVKPGEAMSLRCLAQGAEGWAVVEVEGTRLTVTLDQVPLQEALREIARQTGLRILVNSALDDRLSLAFDNLSVEEGLRRLIRGHSVLFLYTPAGELREVWVYASQPADLLPSMPSPAAVTAPEEAPAFPPTLTDPEPAQRLAAALALTGTEEAEAALGVVLDLLTPHTDPEIRERALGILTFFKDMPVDHIAQVALLDPEPSLRLEAVQLLGQQAEHDPAAHTALRQVAKAALDETVREHAQALLHGLEGSSDQ